MVMTPAEIPVATPVALPMLPIAVLLLVQLPLPVTSASVVFSPTHTTLVPVIAAGTGLTVKGAVVKQPVGNV